MKAMGVEIMRLPCAGSYGSVRPEESIEEGGDRPGYREAVCKGVM